MKLTELETRTVNTLIENTIVNFDTKQHFSDVDTSWLANKMNMSTSKMENVVSDLIVKNILVIDEWVYSKVKNISFYALNITEKAIELFSK